MSVFSNGGYVPPGMEFDEFIEYQEAYRNYLDEQEFFKFLEEEYPEEVGSSEPIIKVTGELLDSIRSTADYVLGDIKNNMVGRTKEQKLESISELQEQNHKRLLFEFIKQNGVVSEYEFIFEGEPTSFLDEEFPCKKNYNKNRRIHRGLFISNNGIKINADVNGAYQILKKVIPNAFADGIEGVGLHPTTIKLLVA